MFNLNTIVCQNTQVGQNFTINLLEAVKVADNKCM